MKIREYNIVPQPTYEHKIIIERINSYGFKETGLIEVLKLNRSLKRNGWKVVK